MKISQIARAGGLAFFLAAGTGAANAESLTQALASAYANNPQIVSAILGAKISAESIVSAKSGLRPTIGLSGSMNNSWTVSGGSSATTTTSSFGVSYSQTLFDSYQTNASVEAARASAIAQAESARVTEQTVLLAAANAYVGVVRDTRLVKLRADIVTFLRAQAKSAQDRLNIGEGTKIELSQAQASLAQAVANYQSAINDLQLSQATYARYMGHAPKNLSLVFPYDKMLPTSLQAATALAEKQHPSILASRAAIRAAKASLDATKSAYGPTVSLSGSAAIAQNYSSGSSVPSASVGLTVSVPLYAGGALGAAERKANLSQIQSEVDARNVRDEINTAVISAWTSLKSAAATIAAITSSENASQQALEGVIEELKVGQATTLDVLNARSDLTTIQVSKITAEANKVTAAFGLLSAVGRLSAPDLHLPVKIQSADGYRAKVEDVWAELRALPE